MPRLFTRILTFKVEGEIYDTQTKAEDIIKNYSWSFRDDNNGKIYLYAFHQDSRGRISQMTKLPKIHRWKKSDTEFFLTL
jgi:hypothetical protein